MSELQDKILASNPQIRTLLKLGLILGYNPSHFYNKILGGGEILLWKPGQALVVMSH